MRDTKELESTRLKPLARISETTDSSDCRISPEAPKMTLKLESGACNLSIPRSSSPFPASTSTAGKYNGEHNWTASPRWLISSEREQERVAAAPQHSLFYREGNSCHRTASVQMKVKKSRTVVSPVISQSSQMHQQMASMKEGQLQRQA